MREINQVTSFLDHNDHVGLSFYATDAAELAKTFTRELREVSGDSNVVVLVRTFKVKIFREVFEPVVFSRYLSVRSEITSSPVVCVRVDYRNVETRIAGSWLECFISRSSPSLEQSEGLRLLQRVVTG